MSKPNSSFKAQIFYGQTKVQNTIWHCTQSACPYQMTVEIFFNRARLSPVHRIKRQKFPNVRMFNHQKALKTSDEKNADIC